jgi:Fe-S-cluster containining protein
MSRQPWFKDGLRFQCTQCGDCCSGAPGYVWVNQQEIAGMAAELNLEVAEFEKQYVRLVGIRKSLTERPNGDCILLDSKTRKCTVYGERPRQCRTWPFWESNVSSPEAWKETCEACPGCDKGKVVPVDQILHQVSVIRI